MAKQANKRKMSNPMHDQILDFTMLHQNSNNPSVRRLLESKINELERCLSRGIAQPAPVTLKAWLLAGNQVVEFVPSLSHHVPVNQQPRLTAAVRSIFRGVMKDFRALILRGKSHGRISIDTIVVWKGTARLINSLDHDGDYDTYRADYRAIANVLTEIVGDHPFPADAAHFKEIISREELPTGVLQAFVLSHSAFWSDGQIVCNVIALRSSYYLCGNFTQIAFENATLEIPHRITDNWQFRVQNSPVYGKVLAKGPKAFIERTIGLRLMAFYRHALLHAHKEVKQLAQNDIEKELYAMFPDFLAYFIEKSYHLPIVREICEI